MATAASIRVVKQMLYRGQTRLWSNRYHFDGGAPSDSTHWTTFSDAVVTAEKACYYDYAHAGSKIVETVGYAGGSEIPVFSKTYTTDGTITFSAGVFPAPGDVCALVRYSTGSRSSKNHPIYCFNYFHTALQQGGLDPDTLWPTQKTAIQTYASSWLTGFSDGTTNHKRCRPDGGACTGVLMETLVTHRDLPR